MARKTALLDARAILAQQQHIDHFASTQGGVVCGPPPENVWRALAAHEKPYTPKSRELFMLDLDQWKRAALALYVATDGLACLSLMPRNDTEWQLHEYFAAWYLLNVVA